MRKLLAELIILLSIVINTFGQESVKIRTDRDIYVVGEAVWLDVNCFDYDNKIVNGASKVVYVELLNASNTPVQQMKIYLEDGKASTRFVLTDSISTGNFLLRAYTRWMRNYNESMYAYKLISVINPFSAKKFPSGDQCFATDTLIVNAESNTVLKNYQNNLLVRSYNKKGKAITLEGTVFAPNGDSITTISTKEDGMAYISFLPDQVGKYVFQIEADKDRVLKLPFVKVLEKGAILSIASESTFDIGFKISATDKINNGKIHIVTSNGRFLLSKDLDASKTGVIQIQKKDLPGGILIARIVNGDSRVLAGRYFMANAKTNSACKVGGVKSEYSTREKVVLSLSNSFQLDNVSVSVVKSSLLSDPLPLSANMWLNLLDAGKMQKNELNVNNILTAVNPATSLMKSSNYEQFAEIEGEIISGKVINEDTNKPISNETFMLGFVSENPEVYLSKTNSVGQFKFVVNEFGEQDMVIQPFKHVDSLLNYHIDLESAFCQKYQPWKAPFVLSENRVKQINKSIVGMQVKVLYERYQSYQNNPTTSNDKLSFYGNPLYSTNIEKFIDLPNMEEVFNEIVDVVYLRKRDGKLEFNIVDKMIAPHQKRDVLFMVDGIPVWDSQEILKLNPESVKRIEVVNLNYFLNENNLGYILGVFTNDGDLSAYNFDERLFRQSHQCYIHNYEFEGPDYERDSTGFERIPDFRNTLYLQSNIMFDKQNQTEISFYTSDEKENYTVVVEGFNQYGELERTEVPFVVK